MNNVHKYGIKTKYFSCWSSEGTDQSQYSFSNLTRKPRPKTPCGNSSPWKLYKPQSSPFGLIHSINSWKICSSLSAWLVLYAIPSSKCFPKSHKNFSTMFPGPLKKPYMSVFSIYWNITKNQNKCCGSNHKQLRA